MRGRSTVLEIVIDLLVGSTGDASAAISLESDNNISSAGLPLGRCCSRSLISRSFQVFFIVPLFASVQVAGEQAGQVRNTVDQRRVRFRFELLFGSVA